MVKFSPDGTQILLLRDAGAGEEAWLMPYPANAANPPHRILQGLPLGRTTFSWMPNNRHVVVSASRGMALPKLYIADTVSGSFALLSSGTTPQGSPAVSPDGRKLVFVEAPTDFDIVSMNLATAAVGPLIATTRNENQPAWAARESAMVYVTDRTGVSEIWSHKTLPRKDDLSHIIRHTDELSDRRTPRPRTKWSPFWVKAEWALRHYFARMHRVIH